MKRIVGISMAVLMLGATAVFAVPTENNPFTGEPIKANPNEPAKKTVTTGTTPTLPMPNPYIPAPSMMNPQMPQGIPAKQEEKKKERKPEERFVIDGIVNDSILIKDYENEDRMLYVSDLSMLENGCLVKYPSILCGDMARRAMKLNEDKDELSHKVINMTKENTAIRNKLSETNAKFDETNKRYKQFETETASARKKDELKIIDLQLKLDTFTKTLSEKQKAEMQSQSLVKTNEATIDRLKKEHEAALATQKKNHEDIVAALVKKQIEEIASLKKTNDTEIDSLRKTTISYSKTLQVVEPKLEAATKEVAACNSEIKDVMTDMSMLTSIVFKSNIGIDYNIPKIGKFKGVVQDNLIFAFVPIESKAKADNYLKATMLRAYKTDKYILYINNKKLIED